MISPKFRNLYLALGAIGLLALLYQGISSFPEIDPVRILFISVPDMLVFFLAYKTYPAEPAKERTSNFHQHRKVSNY